MDKKKKEGCFNKSADSIDRVNKTWSDTNMNSDYTNYKYFFERLICRNCDSTVFEILDIGEHQTAGKCIKCGMYYLVHCG